MLSLVYFNSGYSDLTTTIGKLVLAVICLALSSCANWNSIHRETKVIQSDSGTEATAISVDAKQRFLLSGTRNGAPVFCSEPSPDVFSVFSAALEASGSSPESIQAALNLTTAEQGGTIGIRTQSIQLLRDAMYRICEAYLANGITESDYNNLLKRYQKSMVTLIAVEQLTGSVRPAQIYLGTEASIESSNDILAAKEGLDSAKKRKSAADQVVNETNSSLTEAKTEFAKTTPAGYEATCTGDENDQTKPADADKNKCAPLQILDSNHQNAISAQSQAEKDLIEWQHVYDSVRKSQQLSAKGSGQALQSHSQASLDNETVAALAKEVRELVRDVFMDEFIQTCLENTAQLAGTEVERVDTISSALTNSRRSQESLQTRLQGMYADELALNQELADSVADRARLKSMRESLEENRQLETEEKERQDLDQAMANIESELAAIEVKEELIREKQTRLTRNIADIDGQIANIQTEINNLATGVSGSRQSSDAASDACSQLIASWAKSIGKQSSAQ